MDVDYVDLGRSVGVLVAEKQAAYGNSFGEAGKVMRVLFPRGIPEHALDEALTLVRVIDKLFRVARAAEEGTADPMGESPWRDIAGYALLSLGRAR